MKKIIKILLTSIIIIGAQQVLADVTIKLDITALPNVVTGTFVATNGDDPGTAYLHIETNQGTHTGAINAQKLCTENFITGTLTNKFTCTLINPLQKGDFLKILQAPGGKGSKISPLNIPDVYKLIYNSKSNSKSKNLGSIRFTCKNKNALNYDRFGRHKESLCIFDSKKRNEKTNLNLNKKCPIFKQYLKIGDIDGKALSEKQKVSSEKIVNEVRLLQKTLYTLGINSKSNIDGVFGKETKKAVSLFQLKYSADILAPWNLQKPTGRFYQSTNVVMNKKLGCNISETLDNGFLMK